MKILSVILLLAALAMAFLAMIFGTRFAALLNKGQQRHGLPEKERRQRNRSGAVFALCLCAVFGLAWLAGHLFQAGCPPRPEFWSTFRAHEEVNP